MVGGTVGTLLRASVGLALPVSPGTWPWATLLVNLVGAAVLPALLELVGRLRRRFVAWRLVFGTGLLGGFTTYSAFSVETVQLLRHGQHLVAGGYAVATVLGGLAVASLSLAAVTRLLGRGDA